MCFPGFSSTRARSDRILFFLLPGWPYAYACALHNWLCLRMGRWWVYWYRFILTYLWYEMHNMYVEVFLINDRYFGRNFLYSLCTIRYAPRPALSQVRILQGAKNFLFFFCECHPTCVISIQIFRTVFYEETPDDGDRWLFLFYSHSIALYTEHNTRQELTNFAENKNKAIGDNTLCEERRNNIIRNFIQRLESHLKR